MSTLRTIWDQAWTVQSPPQWWLTALAIGISLSLVVPRRTWPLARNVVTIAHEGGHALVAFLSGRRLAGVSLHSDTSGVTVSSGKPTGLGMILTAAAGYVAPSLFGLGGAWMLSHGRVMATLWLSTFLLVLMFALIRNLYGVLTVALTGFVVFAISWWTPDFVQAAFATTLAWFLLVSGPRPVWELQAKRKRGQAPESDADQLAALTGIPGLVWVGIFMLTAIASLASATYMSVRAVLA